LWIGGVGATCENALGRYGKLVETKKMVTSDSEFRELCRFDVADARRKRDTLGASSHVAAALTDEILEAVDKAAVTLSIPDLQYSKSPYIFNFVAGHDIDAISELDADIDLVMTSTGSSRRFGVSNFLRTTDERTGVWFG
jgi:hypothetical protein